MAGEIRFDPGELRELVALSNPRATQILATSGENPEEYAAPFDVVYAAVESLTGSKQMIARQAMAEATHRVRLWLHPQVTERTRLEVRGREELGSLYVQFIQRDYAGGTMELTCLAKP